MANLFFKKQEVAKTARAIALILPAFMVLLTSIPVISFSQVQSKRWSYAYRFA